MSAGKIYYQKDNFFTNSVGQKEYSSPGPFASIARIDEVLCEDGVLRTAFMTGQPDTYFSVPATVRVKGKWVSGFVTSNHFHYKDVRIDYWCFIAYTSRKNSKLIEKNITTASYNNTPDNLLTEGQRILYERFNDNKKVQ